MKNHDPERAGRSASLTWYGQAGFRLAAGDSRVLVDPFLTGRPDRRYQPPAAAPDFGDITLVLFTRLVRESGTPAAVLVPPRAHPVTLTLP